MAALLSRSDTRESLPEDDYRAYLVSRNPPPIVHHARSVRLKRLQVHARYIVNGIDFVLHWMIEALARSKTRRIQRELQIRGIRYRDDDTPSQHRQK
jgi:hypothetical protein